MNAYLNLVLDQGANLAPTLIMLPGRVGGSDKQNPEFESVLSA